MKKPYNNRLKKVKESIELRLITLYFKDSYSWKIIHINNEERLYQINQVKNSLGLLLEKILDSKEQEKFKISVEEHVKVNKTDIENMEVK